MFSKSGLCYYRVGFITSLCSYMYSPTTNHIETKSVAPPEPYWDKLERLKGTTTILIWDPIPPNHKRLRHHHETKNHHSSYAVLLQNCTNTYTQ